MIELNTTGYMHNRSRLITSNFLNRMLGYHWKVGEKYFATKLTDYDPAVNNGNWQWIASTELILNLIFKDYLIQFYKVKNMILMPNT